MKLSVVRRFFCKKNPLSNKKESMMYDMKAFEKVNDKNFIKKMEKIEKIDRVSRSKSNKTLVPVLLAATSVGIYCLWQQVPYSRMFKHFTLNEYSFQKGYLHTIPLSSLSFQSDGHFIVYFPLMLYAFSLNSNFLSNRRVLSVFIINSTVAAAAAYLHEKTYYNYLTQRNNLITPKCNGAVT